MYKNNQLVSETILSDIAEQFSSLGLFVDSLLSVRPDWFDGHPGFAVNGYGEIDSDICFAVMLIDGKINIHGHGLNLECNPGNNMRPEIVQALINDGYIQTWIK